MVSPNIRCKSQPLLRIHESSHPTTHGSAVPNTALASGNRIPRDVVAFRLLQQDPAKLPNHPRFRMNPLADIAVNRPLNSLRVIITDSASSLRLPWKVVKIDCRQVQSLASAWHSAHTATPNDTDVSVIDRLTLLPAHVLFPGANTRYQPGVSDSV